MLDTGVSGRFRKTLCDVGALNVALLFCFTIPYAAKQTRTRPSEAIVSTCGVLQREHTYGEVSRQRLS